MDIQRAVASYVCSRLSASLFVLYSCHVLRGDEKTIKKFTIGVQQKRLMEVIRARDPSKVYVWSSEAPAQNEAKVVSIRAFEQNLSREEPKFGNRLTVQALVRFDTMQVRLPGYTSCIAPVMTERDCDAETRCLHQKRSASPVG